VNAEETAERFSAARPGFVLASYGEVALPFFRVRLRLQVLERKEIGPIEEFLLRGVGAGLSDVSTLRQALGLDDAVISASLVELVAGDAIEIVGSDSDEDRLALCPRGYDLLSDAEQIVSVERTVDIDFDGLLRVPVPALLTYLEPRELDRRGIREIPPYPAKRPDRTEMRRHAAEIEQIARQAGGARQQLSDVLAVRQIERRLRIFQPAVALVYRAAGTQRSQGQVAFAIGGKLSEGHADVFARAGLGKKLGIAKRGLEDATAVAERVLGKELIEHATEPPEPRDGPAMEIPGETVRSVETYEHPKLLREALLSARERLLLISPWLKAGVVDDGFMDLLEAALERGVNVYIGWGMSSNETDSPDADPKVLQRLTELSRKQPGFEFKRLGNTHAKVLLCDDRFVVVTSFNWLSFQGNPKRTFRDERGMMVSVKKNVDEQFETLRERFR
jgi:hypothetical protein